MMIDEKRKNLKTFEELDVWPLLRSLTKDVYEVSKRIDFAHEFLRCDQMRRAAISVRSKSAEGFDRQLNKELMRFLTLAKASAAELRSQLYLAFNQVYMSQKVFDETKLKVESVTKQLVGFIRYLQQKGAN